MTPNSPHDAASLPQNATVILACGPTFAVWPGTCPALPSWRGEGDTTGCKAAGSEKLEAYSLEYVEDFSGPRTMQMVVGRAPQQNGQCQTGS